MASTNQKNNINVLDKLLNSSKAPPKEPPDETEEEEEDAIPVPAKCATCHNNVICSVLPQLASMLRVGIGINVEQCIYRVPRPS